MKCEQRESGWLRNAHHLAAILLLNVVGFHWANTVEKHVKIDGHEHKAVCLEMIVTCTSFSI